MRTNPIVSFFSKVKFDFSDENFLEQGQIRLCETDDILRCVSSLTTMRRRMNVFRMLPKRNSNNLVQIGIDLAEEAARLLFGKNE